MKTAYSPEFVQEFLGQNRKTDASSVEQLVEGHISQAFSFETNEHEKLVFRISSKDDDFRADKYAAEHFGSELFVPEVLEIGKLDEESFYCISRFAEGKTTDILSKEELQATLPSIQDALAATFTYDISATQGYGALDTTTGDAAAADWKAAISKGITDQPVEIFKNHAIGIGLDPAIVDQFYDQFEENLPYASEVRRLCHGDPALNNMLAKDGKVTAIIDWAQMGYGDWMSDFARLDFWWPDRYGDVREFAEKYSLDADNLKERKALYWATNALWTIEYSNRARNKPTNEWLHEHAAEKLIS